ncbi:hypothetical protein [Streptomyces sp. V2I9]|uniref:hypothetical protein n=1 Tax=Streptomyces sp. V2I9 TaxID=3042304 RepID=UPI0027D8B82E|nr:hypothetical protein [Streptomyces sp. V2I9]
MNHLPCGLAANENLPSPRRPAVSPTARRPALWPSMLTAADVDPPARPDVALALLDTGAGPAAWARLLATDPAVEHREKLAARPDLPPDVLDTLAADTDVRVVEEVDLRPARAASAAAHTVRALPASYPGRARTVQGRLSR